jgi:hypothetical protein
VPAEGGTDPRNECDDKGVTSCGTTGVCNGAGACRVYAAGQVCNPTPSCNATNTAVIPSYVCNGAGACVAGAPQDCKGFLCAAAACGTTCTSDATCATGAFCAAGGCVPGPANLAGNGDLEYGTTVGWDRFGGGGTLSISSTAASGVAHGGQYSAVVTGRAQPYQGPSYDIPTGLGRYVISAWGMQQADSTLTGILQIALLCNTTTQYVNVQTSGFGIAMPKDTWTQFSATIDTSAGVAADCLATATPPGVIRRATLYLNQSGAGTPTADPDLFMDDVVVQVTDGHNLVANSTFEAGVPSGWAVSGAGTLAVSATAVANGGTKSLFVSGRTTSISGPSYPLPIGAAKYSITFHAMHAGASVHDLVLQSSYTCVGGAPTTPPAIATAAATPGNTWTTLAGTVTLPPLNATAGCRLTQAEVHVQQEAASCGTIECPDIYVDDVAITVAP